MCVQKSMHTCMYMHTYVCMHVYTPTKHMYIYIYVWLKSLFLCNLWPPQDERFHDLDGQWPRFAGSIGRLRFAKLPRR